jgi:hypothetical protein
MVARALLPALAWLLRPGPLPAHAAFRHPLLWLRAVMFPCAQPRSLPSPSIAPCSSDKSRPGHVELSAPARWAFPLSGVSPSHRAPWSSLATRACFTVGCRLARIPASFRALVLSLRVDVQAPLCSDPLGPFRPGAIPAASWIKFRRVTRIKSDRRREFVTWCVAWRYRRKDRGRLWRNLLNVGWWYAWSSYSTCQALDKLPGSENHYRSHGFESNIGTVS